MGVSAQSVLILVAVSAVTNADIIGINRISKGHLEMLLKGLSKVSLVFVPLLLTFDELNYHLIVFPDISIIWPVSEIRRLALPSQILVFFS